VVSPPAADLRRRRGASAARGGRVGRHLDQQGQPAEPEPAIDAATVDGCTSADGRASADCTGHAGCASTNQHDPGARQQPATIASATAATAGNDYSPAGHHDDHNRADDHDDATDHHHNTAHDHHDPADDNHYATADNDGCAANNDSCAANNDGRTADNDQSGSAHNARAGDPCGGRLPERVKAKRIRR
jgi:hypothetical protein